MFHADRTDFEAAIVREDAVTAFVEVVLSSRVCYRRRRSYDNFIAAVRQGRRRGFTRRVVSEAFALYCLLRRTAVPSAPVPTVLADLGGVHLARRVQRHLRRHGIVGHTVSDRGTLQARANVRLAEVWDAMEDSFCVVWMDNYYRKRFVANPVIGYNSLSCSVLSVLNTRRFPTAPELPTLPELVVRRQGVTADLIAARTKLLAIVTDLNTTDVTVGDIRVPLDVHRPSVKSLQWCPFQLSPLSVSGSVGFLKLMHYVDDTVRPHVGGTVPVLMDLNLYYRHLKLCYGRGYARWEYREQFRYCPALFGVWHSFKYACQQVYRRFHSQVLYLLHGTVAAGDNFPTQPRLRSMELLYAALLVLPTSVKDALRTTVSRCARTLESVRRSKRIWEACQVSVRGEGRTHAVSHDVSERLRRLRRLYERREDVALQRLRQAEAMERLVNGYVPALFVIGQLVRECNWNGRSAGSSHSAVLCMRYSAVVMFSLLGDRATRTEHLRDLCLALMMWQPWHDHLRGCMFSEELPEASLGRLGEALRSNPHVVTSEGAEDVFLACIRPGQSGLKEVRAEHPTSELVAMVRSNIERFRSSDVTVVTHVPWKAGRMCTAVAGPIPDHAFPPPLGNIPPFEDLKTVLGHFIFRLITCKEPEEDSSLRQELDSVVWRRPLPERLDFLQALDQARAQGIQALRMQFPRNAQIRVDSQGEGQVARGFRGGPHRRVSNSQQ